MYGTVRDSLLHTNINKEMKGEMSGWTELRVRSFKDIYNASC